MALISVNIPEKPEILISIKDRNALQILEGKLNPRKAFFAGKVRVHGSMTVAAVLLFVFTKYIAKFEKIYQDCYIDDNNNESLLID